MQDWFKRGDGEWLMLVYCGRRALPPFATRLLRRYPAQAGFIMDVYATIEAL